MTQERCIEAPPQGGFGRLRLVANAARSACPHALAPILRLESHLAGEGRDGRIAQLTAALTKLAADEEVHFVHRLLARDGVPFDYEFAVEVAAPPGRIAPLRDCLQRALVAALPLHCLTVPDAAAEAPNDWSLHMPHVAVLLPTGAHVCMRPAPAHASRPRPVPAFPELAMADAVADARVPFPSALPTGYLVQCLAASADLPRVLELRIVARGFTLDAAAQECAHRLVQRITGGNLAIYHPDSPVTAFSESSALSEGVVRSLREWLRHPQGYALACVARSSAALHEALLAQLGGEVFGPEQPLCIHREDPDTWRTGVLAFAQAFRPGQGLPSLAPSVHALATFGMVPHFAPPKSPPPAVGAALGETASAFPRLPVALPAEARSRHVMLVGASGSGKSSLLLNLCAADLRAADPPATIVIDPHGDLAARVLALVPQRRERDVIVIDVADPDASVSINPLEGMRDDPRHAQFVANEIMSLVENLFEDDHTTGPMLRSNLRNLLLLAAWAPQRAGTLLDALRILEDSDYRAYLLGKCGDRAVVDYWRRFVATNGDQGFANWTPYLMARLVPFVGNPVMKRLICRPQSSIDIERAINERAIVVVSLSRAVLQAQECRVLGTLLLMKVFAAALKRARLPEALRAPCHLYIDEAHAFATDAFPAMLAEGRKYGLCITTANQQLAQLGVATRHTKLADALVGNTASKFFFRLSPLDQDMLKPYYRGALEGSEMASLPDFHAVACLPKDNRPLPPFVMRVAAPEIGDPVRAARVTAQSRQRHATPHAQANRELSKLYDLSLESLGASPQGTARGHAA